MQVGIGSGYQHEVVAGEVTGFEGALVHRYLRVAGGQGLQGG
jgi:hypothetical protein